MKTLALIATLVALASPAMAQFPPTFGQQQQQTITTPQGMWSSLPQQQSGGYRYNSYTGPQGQMLNCSSTQVGNQTYTNCN